MRKITVLAQLLLTLIFGLAWKMAESAAIDWLNGFIAGALNIANPTGVQLVNFVATWGPPAIAAALVLLGYHLLSTPKHPPNSEHPREAVPESPSRTAREASRIDRPRYTDKEKAERYEAWSRIYKVLNTTCSTALDTGIALGGGAWKNQIINLTPRGYVERVRAFRDATSSSLQEIAAIYREYEYLTDIREYFESGWGAFQSKLFPAINVWCDTVKRLPENPTHNVISLIEVQAEEHKKGIESFGQWITESKKHVAGQINQLGRD